MILNEFFNLPQVFEKDMAENSPTDPKSWMASIQQEHPDVRFVQAKMPGAPIVALVNGKPVAQFDGKPSVAEDAEQTPFGSVTTTNAPVKPTQYHYGTEPSESEIRKKRLQDIRQRKQDLLRDFAQLGTLRTEMIYGLNNDVFLNKEQLLDYFDNLVDDPNLTALEYAHENGIPVSGLLKAIMSRATQLGISALDVRKLFNSAKAKQGVPEGMFGSRPSPVLPIVAKIDRVARELNPQNVETGKQIIQSHTRDITRMLSPQAKAGVDVIEQGMAEGDFTISDDPSANAKLLFLKTINGNEYRLVKQGNDVYKIYVNRSTKNKQVFPSFDLAKKALQQLLLNAVHTHEQGVAEGIRTESAELAKQYGWAYNQGEYGASMTHPKHGRISLSSPVTSRRGDTAVEREWTHNNASGIGDRSLAQHLQSLKEQGMAEAKGDYVPPKEADYGDKYQAMVRRVGQKAKQQEKAKQQPKAPVRESRLALLKQIIQS